MNVLRISWIFFILGILELSNQNTITPINSYNDTIARCRIQGDDYGLIISNGMYEAEQWLEQTNSSFPLLELHELCQCNIDSRGGFYFLITCTGGDVYDVAPTVPFGLTYLKIQIFGEFFLKKAVLSRVGATLATLKLENGKLRFITPKFFEGLTNLKEISLRRNNIFTLHINLFQSNPLVEEFDISENFIISTQKLCDVTRFWKNFKHLIMKKIPLKIGDYAFTYENSTLEHVDISNCRLEKIGVNAFSSLISLKSMIVNSNPLNLEAMINLTRSLKNIESLEYFEMEYLTHLTRIPTKALENLANITQLNMRYGQYPVLHEYAFPPLMKLKYLDLRSCKIRSIHPNAFERLLNVEEVYLSENHLSSCSGLIHLPNLEVLDLQANNFRLTDFELQKKQLMELVHLKKITFFDSKLHWKLVNGVFDGLFELDILNLENTGLSSIEEYVFQDLTNLTRLHLSKNSLMKLDANVFFGLRNLKQLYINFNKHSMNFDDINPFRELQTIEYISLSNDAISNLPRNLFCDLHYLEIIKLEDNLIVTWNYQVFPRQNKLRAINLKNNKISSVSAHMLQEFALLENLSLVGNPLNCEDCDVQKFQSWVIENQDVLMHPLEHECWINDSVSLNIFNITSTANDCSTDSEGITSNLILIAVVVSFTTIGAIICYKGRWYLTFITMKLRKKISKHEDEQRNFQYDAFVSYSNDDSTWLLQDFIPNIEKKSIKLCLHQRDFTVGVPITDNIIISIERSRKTVLLVSKNYVKSVWCLLEANLAQLTLKEEKRDDIVVVLLQDVPRKLMPNNLRHLLDNRTYIAAPQNKTDDHQLFWNKIIKAIGPNEKSNIV